MTEKVSLKQTLNKYVNSLKIDVKSSKDSRKYLLKVDLEKDSISRLFSYLIELKIIGGELQHIGDEIYDLYNEYKTICKELLGNKKEKPLEVVKKKSASVIKMDIKRSLDWFYESSKLLGIEDEKACKSGGERAHRILALLELHNKKLEYTQGFDRFVFLSYCLSLKFCLGEKNLPDDLPEAISFFLSEQLILLTDSSKILDDPVNYVTFKDIDERIKVAEPEAAKLLDEACSTAFVFAMRWRLILFCDDHNAKGTLLLWDNFVLNKDDVDKFFVDVACAHIQQIPLTENCLEFVERIHKFRKWDDEKIIKTARNIKDDKRSVNSIYIFIAISSLTLIIAFFAYQYFNKQ